MLKRKASMGTPSGAEWRRGVRLGGRRESVAYRSEDNDDAGEDGEFYHALKLGSSSGTASSGASTLTSKSFDFQVCVA
jgi:hypothetical protein